MALLRCISFSCDAICCFYISNRLTVRAISYHAEEVKAKIHTLHPLLFYVELWPSLKVTYSMYLNCPMGPSQSSSVSVNSDCNVGV